MIKAMPARTLSRVMEQGDFRPMAQNREAMSDLVSILEARRDDYGRAEAMLDTFRPDDRAELRRAARFGGALSRRAAKLRPTR